MRLFQDIKEASLPAWFREHPMTKAILKDEAERTLAKRTVAADQVGALRKEQSELIPKLLADVVAKEEIFLKAKTAMEKASAVLQVAKSDLYRANVNFDGDIKQAQEILYETADPLIGETIDFFRKKLDELMEERVLINHLGNERNIFTEREKVLLSSNGHAIRAAIAYCREAVNVLEKMKLEPSMDLEKIEAMKAGIPDINVFTEREGEKFLDRPNSDPLAFIKTESHWNYELKKLNEKFEKLMNR